MEFGLFVDAQEVLPLQQGWSSRTEVDFLFKDAHLPLFWLDYEILKIVAPLYKQKYTECHVLGSKYDRRNSNRVDSKRYLEKFHDGRSLLWSILIVTASSD